MGKKLKVLMLSVSLLATMGIAGCGKKEVSKSNDNETKKIVMVLDLGGVNDRSFNQLAWEGALSAKDKYNVEISYIKNQQESDFTSSIETAVDMAPDLIIGVGYRLTEEIGKAAENYPNQNFAIIDGSFEDIPSNVRQILFNEHQSGYTTGIIAAQMTETKKVGFIGGFDIKSVTSFYNGYLEAIKEENSDIQVSCQYANSFTDAAKGRAIAQQMVADGVDIIFTAGGNVNTGVFEVAKEQGIKAIGVDMPSNQLAPDVIITSACKNVNSGVELTIKDLVENNFTGGEATIYDLSNNGVGYERTHLLPDYVMEYVDAKLNELKK